MREETTKFGTRVYYSGADVPGVIDEAREMFWEPFRSWTAWLRCGRRPGEPYSLMLRVHGREVFEGKDPDVVRLLSVFQAFLDEHADHLHLRSFRRHRHPPAAR